MSLNPAGGALRFEAWRIAGILGVLSFNRGSDSGGFVEEDEYFLYGE